MQKGPITIVLYARKDSYATWKKIKVWTDVTEVKAGDKVARDIFGANSGCCVRYRSVQIGKLEPWLRETALRPLLATF